MIEDLEQVIGFSVREVFRTMINLDMKSVSPSSVSSDDEPHVASSVGFIGRLTGVVYIYCASSFAQRITSALLGMPPAEPVGDELANDAMGELANMIVGHLKSCLSDRGMSCVLTIPSIVRGGHFSIESVSSTQRCVFWFGCEKGHLILEVLIKPAALQ